MFWDRFWVRFGGKQSLLSKTYSSFLPPGSMVKPCPCSVVRSATRTILALALLIPIVVVLPWSWAWWIPLSTSYT